MGPIATQVDRGFEGVDKGVRLITWLNRFQETLTRRGASYAKLQQFLAERGLQDLDNIPLEQIPIEGLAKATTNGLRVTLGESPSAKAPGLFESRVFAPLIETTGKSATAAAIVHVAAGEPFLRFMFSAGRWLAERPFTSLAPSMRTIMRLASPTERAAMTRGDIKPIIKVMEGAVAMLAGYQLAHSQFAGDGIMEIKTPVGTFNTHTLGPVLPAYVWMGRLAKAHEDGSLRHRWPEFTREAARLRQRIEDVTLGVDTIIMNFPDIAAELSGDPTASGAWDVTSRRGGKAIGDTAAGAMQAFTTIQKLFAAYGKFIPELEQMAEQENIRRDLRGSPMTDPVQARIPSFAGQLHIPNMSDLPPWTSSLRAGPMPIEVPPTAKGIPLPSNVIGLKSVVPRTAAEIEALTLGMKPREIQGQPTGFPDADRLKRGETGQMAEGVWEGLLSSPGYKELPREMRAVIMDRVMTKLRETAQRSIQAKINEKVAGGKGLSEEERALIDASIKARLDPRVRDLLRKEGVAIPR